MQVHRRYAARVSALYSGQMVLPLGLSVVYDVLHYIFGRGVKQVVAHRSRALVLQLRRAGVNVYRQMLGDAFAIVLSQH